MRHLTKSPIRIDIACHRVQHSRVSACPLTIQTYQIRIQTKVENETFEDAKYFEWYNPVIQKYLNSELTEYELVYEIFESFEQVSQLQTKLLGATFEMLPGGPAQTHVGIDGGRLSFDMPWGDKKYNNNMTSSRRKR